MTNPTLEKVARAIEATDWKFDDPSWPKKIARAALQSLRQVDDETVEAMRLCTIRNSRPADPTKPFESPFTAAIDHILGEIGKAEVER